MSLDFCSVQLNSPLLEEKLNGFADSVKAGSTSQPTVRFSQAGLDDDGIMKIADTLSTLTLEIGTMDLSCNNIWPEGCKHIARIIEAPSCSVEMLNMQNNHMGDEGVKYIASALADNTSVTLLDLSQNAIGDDGIETLCEALVRNTTIKVLRLSSNRIGANGALFLSNLMGGLGENVHNIVLEEEEPEEDPHAKKKKAPTPEEEAAMAAEKEEKAKERAIVEEKLKLISTRNTSIVELDISSNEIEHTGLQKIAEAIAKHPECLTVNAEDNISSKSSVYEFERNAAMTAIDDAIKHNLSLRVAVVKKAMYFGLHPRVGARSPINVVSKMAETLNRPAIDRSTGKPFTNVDARLLSRVWEYLGPV